MMSILTKRLCLSVTFVLGLISLSACGFQPVYKKSTETGYSSHQALQTIRISPLPDRPGQILHNLLRDRMNPLGQPRKPLYLLKATITETEKDLAVRLDNTTSRTNLTILVKYSLVSLSSNNIVFSSTARSTNSFDKLDDPYANLVAEDTARSRVLRQVADDMALQLGAYFNKLQ
ncbi:LPS assembly lipoprotein LptE [Kiloniella majae]|uniref:LPS assembly lipoprotein LptE n=1 Tax=Kiloniella majae TaxID=1938558 RepID=UPI000F77A292|nr:LPS assembly lipoprotein LptE [Kiloniella majae]